MRDGGEEKRGSEGVRDGGEEKRGSERVRDGGEEKRESKGVRDGGRRREGVREGEKRKGVRKRRTYNCHCLLKPGNKKLNRPGNKKLNRLPCLHYATVYVHMHPTYLLSLVTTLLKAYSQAYILITLIPEMTSFMTRTRWSVT